MNRKPLSWSVKQVCSMIKKGSITFDHPLQRPSGQWGHEDKSLLIDSILRLFIPEIYAIQNKNEDGKGNFYDIIEGKQRCTEIYSYINDEWALTKLKPIKLESTGEVYDISGLKFSQLSEEVQEEIKSFTLTIKAIEIEDGDDEEDIVEEIFYRLNNGKGMSKEHKALVRASHKVQKFVHRIATEHKLFTEVAKFSEGAIKKSDVQMTILQSVLILSGLDFNSFVAKDIEQVFSENDITDQVLELTEKSFDAIFKAFPEKHKFVTKINISSMVYLFANSLNHDETITKLVEYANSKPLPADEYKRFTGAGNVKKANVWGRMKGLLSICGVKQREFITKEETTNQTMTDEEWEQPQRIQTEQSENQESSITETLEDSAENFQEEAQTILNIVNNVA